MKVNLILRQSAFITSITLLGCNLNILLIIQLLYPFHFQNLKIWDLGILFILSIGTFFCYNGVLKIRNKNPKGFKLYFIGQIIEIAFYIYLLIDNLSSDYGYFTNYKIILKILLLIIMFIVYFVNKNRLIYPTEIQTV
jgi:hypothetical protein